MKQPISEIEAHYNTPDPWGYQTHPDDLYRKNKIIETALKYAPPSGKYRGVLDIGAGEGWITKDLPAQVLLAYEVSQQAREHAKNLGYYENVRYLLFEPCLYKEDGSLDWELFTKDNMFKSQIDLVTATGVLYSHYHYEDFLKLLEHCASDIVITCNIKDWEIPFTGLPQIHEEEFPYREYVQKLRVFKKP